jgi:hypothetical protein
MPKLTNKSTLPKIYLISKVASTPSAPPNEKPVTHILAPLNNAVND